MDFLSSGNSIFSQCYFTTSRNHCWNKEKTVLRERAHSCQWAIDFLASGKDFFSLFFGDPCQLFSVQWKRIFQGNPYFQLGETDFRASNGFHKQKKTVNKRTLFPIGRNSDSISQNEGFVKKIRFHFAEKLLSPAEISKKTRKKCFQMVRQRLLYKNGLSKRRLSRKFPFVGMKHQIKNPFPLAAKTVPPVRNRKNRRKLVCN